MDDTISRRAAIKWVKTECNPYGKPTLDFESGKKVIEHLERMPSAEPQWIPVKWHDATDEERENDPSIAYWFDCPMPNDNEEMLTTVRCGKSYVVEKDICYADDSLSLDSGRDWREVVAWMPLPKPYKGEKK